MQQSKPRYSPAYVYCAFFSVLDLIEGKSSGIFDLLDEENKLPKPAPEHFTNEVHNKNKNHYRLSVSISEKSMHREVEFCFIYVVSSVRVKCSIL